MSEQAEKFYSEWYTNESAERTEEPKREFIVALDLENADIEGSIPIANTESIVRCRDCWKWDAEGEPHAIHPDRHWCDEFARYVEPDGFCAWGEPRGDWITCKCGEEIEATSGWVKCPSCGRRWMDER